MAEYEACILGLKDAIDWRIKHLNVFGDSDLVISQVKGDWDTKHPNIIPYKELVLSLEAQEYPEGASINDKVLTKIFS